MSHVNHRRSPAELADAEAAYWRAETNRVFVDLILRAERAGLRSPADRPEWMDETAGFLHDEGPGL